MTSTKSSENVHKWWHGGISAMFATASTHPLDTLKVRVQSSKLRSNLLNILQTIAKQEGILSLYSGLSAALFRQGTCTFFKLSFNEV